MTKRSFQRFCGVSGLAGFLLLGSACAAVQKAYEPAPRPAPYLPPMAEADPQPSPRLEASDGSIYSASASSLFGDDKAIHKGDVVLVQVVQKNSGSKKADTDTSRDSSISATINYALGLEKDINKVTDYNMPAGGTWAPNPLVDASSTNQFTGAGSTTRSDALTALVSAVVTDVLSNGNLVIYGHQTVTLNNESSVLTVQGIVRPTDISPENIVESTRIANANIQFTGNGVISDKQHPGWGTRLFDLVWPF